MSSPPPPSGVTVSMCCAGGAAGEVAVTVQGRAAHWQPQPQPAHGGGPAARGAPLHPQPADAAVAATNQLAACACINRESVVLSPWRGCEPPAEQFKAFHARQSHCCSPSLNEMAASKSSWHKDGPFPPFSTSIEDTAHGGFAGAFRELKVHSLPMLGKTLCCPDQIVNAVPSVTGGCRPP